MSVNYYAYLGPYLQCEYELIPGQQVKWACGNEHCIKHGLVIRDKDMSFCPVCGKLLARQVEVIEKPDVNCWEPAEEIGEALMPIPLEGIELDGPFHIWIPNVKRNRPRKFHYDPHCDLCVVSVEDHLGEVIWFTEAFLKEIKVLKKHYKECLGQWGLIIHPS